MKILSIDTASDLCTVAILDNENCMIELIVNDARNHSEKIMPIIEQATAYMKEAGIAKSKFWAYALVQDVEEAHQRILKLNEMGVTPFAQPYRDYEGGEPTQEQKDLARWCNQKAIFNSCKFEDYKPRKA